MGSSCHTQDIGFKRNFLLVILGRLVSSLGTSIFNFALSLYVLDITGSAAKFSMILGFSFLAQVLVNFFGGVFVDRHNKKNIIVCTDLISGSLVLVFMALFHFYFQSIILLIFYTISLSTVQAIFGLAMNASIPNFVNAETVPKTNSAMQAGVAITNIVGPIIGAIAYKAYGLEMVFLINGVAFILSGISEMFIKYKQNPSLINEEKNYLEDIKVTFEYLNLHKIIGFLFVFAVIINLIFNSLMFLVLPYINYHVIKVSGFQLSLIQASGALGVVLGAAFVSFSSDHSFFLKRFFTLFRMQAVSIMAWVFPLLPIFAGTNKWPITIVFSILLIIYGGMNTVQNVPMISYFQLKIPEAIRGRVFGVFWAALFLTTPLGLWLYGALLTKVQWFYVTFVSGMIMFIIGSVFAGHKYFKEFVIGLKEQNEVFDKMGVESRL
ncbi:MAG: MFS transporter [Firmicutes bacterium]|nr:MFS transporter [Bacillota bacterium]